MSKSAVTKAIIPAAGLGTRFLPATKSQPKEMLPIVDTPTIQYVVEEAVASGITDILMIIGKGKRAIEEHFDRNFELENVLSEKGKQAELDAVRRITDLANIHFVWQKELKGLGDAIAHAKCHVGNNPFAVLLGDTVIETQTTPAIKQLMTIYDRYHESVIAVEEVPRERVSRYGVIDGKCIDDRVYLINNFVEKPKPEDAPSNMVVASRYVLSPDIFTYLESTPPGINEEIQITDALKLMLNDRAIYGKHLEGKRYDIGNKAEFIKASVLFGLKRDDMGDELRRWIKELANEC
ncbi:MAG: UTP--glucose-1-phosphate uridylyltransferase GalU [Chitinivibrionales bacterium]|nr:UTP--glucose-1-phosphate uridylyltransferase GalU [Chitinivibrionales bacterium]